MFILHSFLFFVDFAKKIYFDNKKILIPHEHLVDRKYLSLRLGTSTVNVNSKANIYIDFAYNVLYKAKDSGRSCVRTNS